MIFSLHSIQSHILLDKFYRMVHTSIKSVYNPINYSYTYQKPSNSATAISQLNAIFPTW